MYHIYISGMDEYIECVSKDIALLQANDINLESISKERTEYHPIMIAVVLNQEGYEAHKAGNL